MLRVLYIDDEAELLEICKLYLEENGELSIDTTPSARKGLEMIRQTRYDVIVSDYQMPGMDGLALLKTLREDGSTLPFILFTGRGREEVVIQALNNGADFYIQKGGDPEVLFLQLAHIIRQVAAKRKADELVRETNTYLTNLITYAPNPIVTWDVNSKITRFNRAFETLTGFSEENVLGHDFDILFPEESRARSLDLVVRALFGEKWKAVEIPVRTIHGETRTVIWNSANIYAEDGITPVATIAQGTDITRLAMDDNALRGANTRLNLCASVTRHDILNKITVIDSTLAWIRKRGVPDAIVPSMEKIAAASRAIQDHIEFSRVYQELGSAGPRWQCLAKILPEMPVPQTIRFSTETSDFAVLADPLFPNAFTNLLDNSLRHGGTIREIRVRCRESGDGLVITWEDDGVGIEAGDKETIFEHGYGKNTGLGLSLVREILAITGIAIRETGIPGGGARFEMIVPSGGYRPCGENPAPS